MNKKYQCSECGKLLPQEDFWTHKADDRVWKDHSKREYKYSKCKKCCYKNINWDDKNTILDLCCQFDVPYLEEELQRFINKFGQQYSLGRYLNLMRLHDYYGFGFEDTAYLNELRQQRISYERNKITVNENKYKIIAICGKSAAGKDTLLQQIIKQHQDLHEIVSCTTRPPREGEIDGKNYFFLTLPQFLTKTLNGEMLEATEFRDWLYGTSLEGVAQDKINVGVFNPAGISNLMKNENVQLFVVQVQASNKVRLMRSLNREINPDVDEIVRRYLADKKDFEDFSNSYEPEYIFDSEGVGARELIDTANEIVLLAQRHWAEQEN